MLVLKIAGLIAVIAIVIIYVLKPMALIVNSDKRYHRLLAAAPHSSAQESAPFSPLAERIKNHVVLLSEKIGERAFYQQKSLNQAKDYIVKQFKESGYTPQLIEYQPQGLFFESFKNMPYYNIEAVLDRKKSGKPEVWIIGAHYDTAPGTPGADDNASGIAVLLETARLLAQEKLKNKEIRFVAFSTEEPPAFGTNNMGSYHYAQSLKKAGIRIKGMISLEMLGYYNDNPGSQLYPPFLHWFFPDRGNFIAGVSNLSSWKLLSSFKKAWRSSSNFPLVTASLPPFISAIALSDQLNFWSAGFPAFMLTDTAFFRYPHYHEGSDTPEKLNYENMADVTTALVSILIQN